MKKAFTLIELLAVIIILAIVALIATPLILNVIEDSKKSANLSQAYLILDGAEQLYINSFLNTSFENLLTGTADIYPHINFSGERPPNGEVFLKSNGEVSLSLFIDGACYEKDFTENTISINEDIDIAEDCAPSVDSSDGNTNEGDITLDFDSSVISPSSKPWYYEDVKININSIGMNAKYCVSNTSCEPNLEEGEINVTATNNIVCIELENSEGKTARECKYYNIDETIPTISAINENLKVEEGTVLNFNSNYEATYGISGGEILCNPVTSLGLTKGTHTITCAAVGENNLIATISSEIEVIEKTTADTGFTFSSGTITGYTGTAQHIVIPPQINGEDVKIIGSNAFNNKQLKSVVIPNTVTEIQAYAFRYNQIYDIVIPDSVITIGDSAFSDNDIANIKLGSSLQYIGATAFKYNEITDLVIPNSVTEIKSEGFANNKISNLVLSTSLTALNEAEFSNNLIEHVTIPSSITTLTAAFKNNNIHTLIVPNSVTEFSTSSISENGTIDTLYIPSSVTTFSGSVISVKNLYIDNDSVANLGANKFSTVENLIFGSNVTYVGIWNAKQIKTVTIGNNVGHITGMANNQIQSLIIPDSVTSISASGFKNNNIEYLKLGSGLTMISTSTFEANNLTSITIPSGVYIQAKAFDLNPLSKICLGAGVTGAGWNDLNITESLNCD